MRLYFSLFIALLAFNSYSQEELDISFWSDVMVNANSPEHRAFALNKFQSEFNSVVEKGDAFSFDFSKTPELSILTDSLGTFKIISWQIEGEVKFEYYGYLLKADGASFSLNDAFTELEDIEYLELGPTEWLGGIYYSLVEQGDKYFLFSYRQLDEFTKFKSFDCLSFDKDGTPILGSEVFVKPMNESRDIVKNRIVFSYSADAILSLNYNPAMNMVVHDHLMEVIGQREGQGPTKVPDGTYEGYIYKEGKWIYEEKLFSHTYDTAPRPNQVLGKNRKDVFGKEKKN